MLLAGAAACALGCGGVAAPDAEDGAGSTELDAAAPGQPDAPSGGRLTGTNPFRAFIHLTATAPPNAKRGDVAVVIDVQIARDGSAVSDAVVTAGSLGKAVRATLGLAGHYVVEETGYAPWYQVSVESDGAVLGDVRLRAPSIHSVSVPSRPVKGKPTLVDWKPSHDTAVDDVQLRVFGWDEQKVTYDEHVVDSGELVLPATALPSPGTFVLQVRRATSLTLAAPDSAAIVELNASVETVVR